MPSHTITVIIPTLNEGASIAEAIANARELGADEVIVADGGSADDTVGLAAELGVTVVIAGMAQRARQMNEGARAARSDVLIFLHADTRFLPGSLDRMRAALADERIVGGGFRRRFQDDSRVLAASCFVGNERARWLGWYFGDQAIFVRRVAFEVLGGFPEVARFEDLDFTRRLRRMGRMRLVEPGVETSARRFQAGPIRRITKDVLLTLRHVFLGRARLS